MATAGEAATQVAPLALNDRRRRTQAENVGHVAHATSLAGWEEAARKPDAKGVIWDRGPHALEKPMTEWANGQDETLEGLTNMQLLVAPPHGRRDKCGNAGGCGDPTHHCSKKPRGADPDPEDPQHPPQQPPQPYNYDSWPVATAVDVEAACVRVASQLPEAFRGGVAKDAAAMVAALRRLCPTTPWLTLKVEVIAIEGACSRWHQDHYTCRCICTYTGPGTWCADDGSVRFDQFARTIGAPMHISDPAIVPSFESVHEPDPNAFVLMKGNAWPGIRGVGLTHKSPNLRADPNGEPELKRLMLKVDLAETQPGL